MPQFNRGRKNRLTPAPRLSVTQLEDRTVPAPVSADDAPQHGGGCGCSVCGLDFMPPSISLTDPNGFLTGAQAGDRDAVARSTLAGFAGRLGLTPADVAAAAVSDSYTSHDRSHVYFRQHLDGLPVLNANAGVHLMSDGRALMVNAAFVPNLAASAPAPVPNAISATDAVEWAAHSFGYVLQTAPLVASNVGGVRQTVVVSEPEFSDQDIRVERAFVNTERGVRAVWELVARTPDSEHWYHATVDAQDGRVEFWADWMKSFGTYNVLGMPNEHPNDGPRSVLVNPADPVASPFGWHDTNGVAGAEFTDTRGNNVSAQEDADANNSGGFRPGGGPSNIYDYPFDQSVAPAGYVPAAVTNLFYFNNVMHDVTYPYGFNEASGNFQTNNYGRGGAGNDAVQADAQDGSGTNNANFGTPPDGSAPRMQMYVWTAATPDRDSDFDNGIIAHEYGHGVSNRLTGGPANSSALNNQQSGGMGEGWSDFFALMLTQRPTDLPGDRYGIGTYAINQPPNGTGIRSFPYSYDMAINPMTFANYGTGGGQSTAVHFAGARWCSALWDMNWLLIGKHGYDPDLSTGYAPGGGPASAGNKLTMRLVIDAMKLQPANPSFIQARDAILAADLALTGGQNRREIWAAFARRGLGASAATANSSSTDVTEAFDMPAVADFLPGVVAQSPVSVTTTTPSSLTFTFSEPMGVATFTYPSGIVSFTGPGGDLSAALTGFTWLNNTNLRINFAAQTTPGLYTMVLDPFISALDNGATLNHDFDNIGGEVPDDRYTAHFRFDPTPVTVTAISPANGATAPVSTTFIDVTFSEPFLASSLSPTDLNLSQGVATAAAQISPTQARFTVSAFSGSIGEATIFLSLKYGAVTDVHGFPSQLFNSSFTLDYDTTAFPTPLAAGPPLGSLVYAGTFPLATRVGTGTDTDSFTISLDANQRLSAILTPASGTVLVPVVTILDAGGATVGTATGTAGNAVTATAGILTAGTYTVRVSGSGGSTGEYGLRLLLNASGEGEQYGGTANNTTATAQSLATLLVTPTPGVSVASVVGVAGGTPTETEANGTTGTANDMTGNFAAVVGSGVYHMSWTGAVGAAADADYFNLGTFQAGDVLTIAMTGTGGGAGTLTDAYVELRNASNGIVAEDDDNGPATDSLIQRFTITTAGTYYIRARSFSSTATGTYRIGVRLENTGTAPATGGTFAAETESNNTLATANNASGSWRQVTARSLVGGTITAGDTDFFRYTLTAGDRFTVRGVGGSGFLPTVALLNAAGTVLQTADGSVADESAILGYVIPTTGTYYVRVTASSGTGSYTFEGLQSGIAPPTAPATPDFFSVPLAAGQTFSVGLTGATSTTLQLLDPAGTVLVTGVAAGNYTTAAEVTAGAAGVYFVRVADVYPAPYQLTVSPGAALDREANDTFGTAQPIAAQALGGLTAGDSDYYSVVVGPGGFRLRATTTTPGDGAGEFVNALDPVVEISNPSGVLIATDDNSAGDGRNARATSPTLAAGTYRVRVRTTGGTTGEYTVTTELLPNQQPTGVTAGGPYSIAEGGSLSLTGSATDPDGDALTYSWDVNGDGVFTDATGANPTLTWAQLVALGITDGPYSGNVSVRVTDGFSAPVDSTAVPLSVSNAAPTGTAANTGPVVENSATPVTVSLTGVTDPSGADTAAGFRYAFDFNDNGVFDVGDGTYAGSSPIPNATVPPAFLVDGNASLVVRVRVLDDDGDFNEYTTTVVVTNANPTAGLTGPASIREGDDATVTATGADVPADAPTLRYAYDFGNDGTYEFGGSTYATALTTTTASMPTTDSGPLEVRVRVFDKDGGFDDEVTTIAVDNVAPTATFTNGGSVPEGTDGAVSLGNVSDPSSVDTTAGFTYAFDFDADGTFEITNSTDPTAVVPASFLPDGPATVTVRARVFDKDGDFTEYETEIGVTNANPTASLGNGGAVVEGTSGSVTFTGQADASAADLAALRYAYDFDNDGTFDLGGATYAAAVSSATATVPAAVLANGPFTQVVRAWVIDPDGGHSEYFTSIGITNTLPTGTLLATPSVPVGTPTTVRFTGVVDAPADLTAGLEYRFTFIVNGQPTTLTSATPEVEFTFPDPGTYNILARLTDQDGGFTNYQTTAAVTNVTPSAALQSGDVVEGVPATVSFTGVSHPSEAATAAGFRFAYDFDNDGIFDLGDGTYGGSVAAASASMPANLSADSGPRTVRARVIEVSGLFTDLTTTFTILPAPPVGTLSGPPAPVQSGVVFTVTFGGVTDPSPADTAAGFTYSFDTDGDGVFETVGSSPTVTLTAPGIGVRTITGRVTDQDGAFTDLTTTVTIEAPVRTRAYSVGADAGGRPVAKLFRNNSPILDVTAFDPAFTGGVRVATGDVNGDGVPDLIAGTGPGSATLVRVFSGADGSVLFEVAPFEAAFTGGVYVASGDLDGDGKDEIVISPDEGGGPRVTIFRGGSFARSADFFGIEDPDFRGGARVAFGDLNGDGRADLLVAAGFGGGPRVTGYDGTSVGTGGPLVTMFNVFVFEQSLRNGVFVSAGDLDGDGKSDLVVGGGPGGGPRVLGVSGADLTGGNLSNPATLANFLAGDVDDRGGVRVAAKNLDADALADLVVGDGAGSGGRVKTYLGATLEGGSTDPDLTLDATPGFSGGVFVG
jgi:Zn-dependent metalloprotease